MMWAIIDSVEIRLVSCEKQLQLVVNMLQPLLINHSTRYGWLIRNKNRKILGAVQCLNRLSYARQKTKLVRCTDVTCFFVQRPVAIKEYGRLACCERAVSNSSVFNVDNDVG